MGNFLIVDLIVDFVTTSSPKIETEMRNIALQFCLILNQ